MCSSDLGVLERPLFLSVSVVLNGALRRPLGALALATSTRGCFLSCGGHSRSILITDAVLTARTVWDLTRLGERIHCNEDCMVKPPPTPSSPLLPRGLPWAPYPPRFWPSLPLTSLTPPSPFFPGAGGGLDGALYHLDPAAAVWSLVAPSGPGPAPWPRVWHGFAAAGGRLYVSAGSGEADGRVHGSGPGAIGRPHAIHDRTEAPQPHVPSDLALPADRSTHTN